MRGAIDQRGSAMSSRCAHAPERQAKADRSPPISPHRTLAFGHKQPLGGASGSGRRLPRPAHCIKASINGQVGGAGVGA